MASRINLTVGAIERLTCPPELQQVFLWDTQVIGLGVRASKTGKKTYVLQTRVGRTQFRHTIGSTKDWTLDAPKTAKLEIIQKSARYEASRLNMLCDKGIDPRLERKRNEAANKAEREAEEQAAIAEAMKGVLVADAWAVYIEHNKNQWGARHLRDHEKLAQAGGRFNGKDRTAGPLASLMAMKLSDIDADIVKAWLNKETATRPTQTALAYRLLRAFINWCAEFKAYTDLVQAEIFTARAVKRLVPRKNAKNDLLQLSQLPAWFDAVRRIKSPTMSAYLQVLVLTGARREEIAQMRWEHVDFKWGSILLRDKVEASGRVIPMPPYIEHLLADLKRRNDTPPAAHRILDGKRIANDLKNWKPSPWVFSSKAAACGHIVNPTKALADASLIAGVPDITIHGLRRTFSTHCDDMAVEMPAGACAQIMGHKASAIAEKHYKRRPLDALRAWHIRIERFFIESAGVPFNYDTPAKAQTLRVV